MNKGMMISCEDATKLVIMKSQERLSGWNVFRLALHLAMCKFCSLFQKQNSAIDDAAKELDNHRHFHLPENAKHRIMDEILK
ncbi:MAG: hypothetical protein R2750_08595 [Bacteroidales bacterium]